MPTNEKEYNGYLFDRLALPDDIGEVAEKEGASITGSLRHFSRWPDALGVCLCPVVPGE